MTDPADGDQGLRHWCGTHVPSPGGPCVRTGFLFQGYVDSPGTPVTLEAKVPDPTLPNPWFTVETVISESQNGPPYRWGEWVALDYNMWEPTQGSSPATVMYGANVRAESPTHQLDSLAADRYNCHVAHPIDFLANCKAAGSPAAHIDAVADFGQDAVALINTIRSQEGVASSVTELDAKEAPADQDAKYNYAHKAHDWFEGKSKDSAPGGTGQNETATRPTYDQILDVDLWYQMYVLEKQFHETGTCAEPSLCKSDGHYLNLTDPKYTKVAPGIYVTPDKEFHAVLNFYP